MPLTVTCESCEAKFRLAEKYAGKKIKCPKCKAVVSVPAEEPADAGSGTWYVQTEEGESYGPIPKTELDEWVAEGRLTAECQILREGADQWQWITDEYPHLSGDASADAAASAGAEAGSGGTAGDDNPFGFLGDSSGGGGGPIVDTGGSSAVPTTGSSAGGVAASGNISPRDPLAAGLLAIFGGFWAIHRFYLGDTKMAMIQIVVNFVSCGLGVIWPIIDAINLFGGSYNKDAKGRKLVRQRF